MEITMKPARTPIPESPRNKRVAALESIAEKVARTIAHEHKIKVVMSNVSAYNAELRTLFLSQFSTDVDDPRLETAHRGQLDHELGHVVFTDFDLLVPALERWTREEGSMARAMIRKDLWNLYEDLWVEQAYADRYKGAREHLRVKCDYLFTKHGGKASLHPDYVPPLDPLRRPIGLYNALARSIMCVARGQVKLEDCTPEIQALLRDLEPEIKLGWNARTSADAMLAADRTWEKIKHLAQRREEEAPSPPPTKSEEREEEDAPGAGAPTEEETGEGGESSEEEEGESAPGSSGASEESSESKEGEDDGEDGEEGGEGAASEGAEDEGEDASAAGGADGEGAGDDVEDDREGDAASSGGADESEEEDRETAAGSSDVESDEDSEDGEDGEPGTEEGDDGDDQEAGEEDGAGAGDRDSEGDGGDRAPAVEDPGEAGDAGSAPDESDEGAGDGDDGTTDTTDGDDDGDGAGAGDDGDEGTAAGEDGEGDEGEESAPVDGTAPPTEPGDTEPTQEGAGTTKFLTEPDVAAQIIEGEWHALPTDAEVIANAYLDNAAPAYTVHPLAASRDEFRRYTGTERSSGREVMPALERTAGPYAKKLQSYLVGAFAASRQSLAIGGMEDGDELDEDAIPGIALRSRDRNVFTTTVRQVEESAFVMILVDCSGSMGHSGIDEDMEEGLSSKAAYAAVTAMTLHRALVACRVPHAVLGYTTTDFGDRYHGRRLPADNTKLANGALQWSRLSSGLQMHEFVPAPGLTDDGSALPYITGRYNNLDGESVLFAAKYAAKHGGDRDRVIMFVVADGLPAGADDSTVESTYLRDVVEQVAAANIEVYGIGVGIREWKVFSSFYPDVNARPGRAPTGSLEIKGGEGLTDGVLRKLTQLLTRGYGLSRR